MKNLTTILTELGIEVPEEKKSELEKQLGENYKPVSEVEKVRAARDNYKTQLDTAQETIKSFEGVDVNELQGKISTLQNDLAAQKTAFEQQISDMEFNSMLEDAIGKAGARSVKPAREYKWFIPIRVTLTGCDCRPEMCRPEQCHFNPRTPDGVRLVAPTGTAKRENNFNPRTPDGVRRYDTLVDGQKLGISIHAPLTGCDSVRCSQPPSCRLFQSTHP